MKPEIYATKKAIAPITIAMVIMIRSRLSSGNMTQDGGISLEYTVACRAPSDSFIPSPRLAIDGLPETNDTFVISNEPHGQTPRHIARCTSLENYRGSPFVGTLQGYSSSPLRRDSEQENG